MSRYGDYLRILLGPKVPYAGELLNRNLTILDAELSRLLRITLSVEDRDFPQARALIPSKTLSQILWRYPESISIWETIQSPLDIEYLTIVAQGHQPVVSVQCFSEAWHELPGNSTWIRGPHPNGTGLVDFISLGDFRERTLKSSSNSSNQLDELVQWIAPPQTLSYSLLAVFFRLRPGDLSPDTSLAKIINLQSPIPGDTTLEIAACGINASWQRAEYQLWNTMDLPIVLTEPRLPPESELTSHIRILESWANKLFSNNDLYTWYLEPYNNYQIPDYTEFQSLEVALATIFAQSIADNYISQSVLKNITNGPCDENMSNTDSDVFVPNWLEPCATNFSISDERCNMLSFTITQSGYGYNASTTPVILSLVILGLYCVLAGGHLIRIFCTRTTCTAWDTSAELVALALQSKCPEIEHMKNTSVGIETMATFREPVGIRENEEGRLVLVFMNDPGQDKRVLKKVEVNKAY